MVYGVCILWFKASKHLLKEEKKKWQMQLLGKILALPTNTPSFPLYKIKWGALETSDAKWWLVLVSNS